MTSGDVPLIVFADDWGRHPSSCQHLIRHLLPLHPVVWVNTIGTRPPRLNWATARRGVEKLRQWTISKPPASVDSTSALRPRILNPKMWPSFHSRFARNLNRRLLVRAIKPIAESLPQPPIVITTLPLTADLVGRFPASRWIYYCVDDFGVWPGLDGQTLRLMEEELVRKVDKVIAVSETLRTHIAQLGEPSELLTHGVDLEHWRKPIDSTLPESIRELAALPSPRIVFWGVIDQRMDVAFVRCLAETMTLGTILLVGPKDDPDEELMRIPRVHPHPPIAYDDLPALASIADVLIMPYADLPVTRAIQPLKLKEYLATGKPVVSRLLPATRAWGDCLDLAETPKEFAEKVLLRCGTGATEEQRKARGRIESESWAAKAEQFKRWVEGG